MSKTSLAWVVICTVAFASGAGLVPYFGSDRTISGDTTVAATVSGEQWRDLCIKCLNSVGEGPLSSELVENLLSMADTDVIYSTLDILSNRMHQCQRFKVKILELHKHEDKHVKSAVLRCTAHFKEDPEVKRVLETLLADKSGFVREMAIARVAQFHMDDWAYTVLLRSAIEGENGDNRIHAIAYLMEHYPHKRDEFAEILSKHPNERVRFAWQYMLRHEAMPAVDPCDDPEGDCEGHED